jgi:HEAT repeat protein
MLEDPNEQVRWWAAFALARGRYTTQENAQAMYKALDDTSDAVQNRAATSLKGMM